MHTTYDSTVSHHERSLLSGLFTGRVSFQDIDAICQPDDLIGDCHASIMHCLRDIAFSGVPLALSTIEAEMRSRNILERFGGSHVLREWSREGTATYRAASFHASQIAEAARKRRLRSVLLEAVKDSNTDLTTETIINSVSAQLRDLQPVNQDDFYLAGEAADAALKEIETAWSNQGSIGLPTGLRDLDEHIGGFRPGQMIVLAARPSIGKSCVGAEIAQRIAEAGNAVLFANLEMSKPEMGTRFLSRLSGLPSNLLREPAALKPQDIEALKRARDRIANYPLILWGGSGRTFEQLASATRRHHARNPLSLLVIDYLGLLNGPGKDRYQQVSAVSLAIKALAMELQIPILTLCQLNRDSEKHNREPSLADLRDSGAIEQDADIVVLIVRDRDSSDCKLKVDKYRNGSLGSVYVCFEGAYSRVDDCEKVVVTEIQSGELSRDSW